MNHLFVAIIGFTISVPAVIGLVRLRRIDKTYYPFIFYLFLGILNEVVSFILIRSGESNAVTGNLYLLLGSLLISYQFFLWDLFKNKAGFSLLCLFLLGIWIGEVYFIRGMQAFASYFIMLYSLFIVFLSIAKINQLLDLENRQLLRNPVFIICTGFILFYTIAFAMEAFYLYGTSSNLLQKYIFRIMVFINLPTNFLYSLAALWIPRKKIFLFWP